jgi:hypothetical protein
VKAQVKLIRMMRNGQVGVADTSKVCLSSIKGVWSFMSPSLHGRPEL